MKVATFMRSLVILLTRLVSLGALAEGLFRLDPSKLS